MPLQNVTIKNVPMDYFLNGVKAVRPQGAQPPQAPGQQPLAWSGSRSIPPPRWSPSSICSS